MACIIAFRGNRPDPFALGRMTDVIAHRGPDDYGYHLEGNVGFGFRRLAILDLSPAGHQPFTSADGRFTIVFNGEIFNFLELRRELQSFGHVFRSTGDTEVLLHAYMQWGRDCLPRLNGMFAFLIHDRTSGAVFGARDRFGKKPLFRYRADDAIYLASEIKSIRASGAYPTQPNWGRVSDLLVRPVGGANVSVDETFYEGITQVPASGCFEILPDGTERSWTYWSLEPRHEPGADPVRDVRDLLEDAVRLRLRSDVPVGVSLSGGIDSSSIIALVARLRAAEGATAPLKAFSYIDPAFDETEQIQANVANARADLHLVSVSPQDMWERLDKVLWYHDEPLFSATVLVGFEVYRLAAQHGVKVVLGGQGADEIAAGYPPYFVDLWCTLIRRGQLAEARAQIRAYAEAFGQDAGALFRRAIERSVRLELRRLPGYASSAARRQHHRDLAAPTAGWFSPEVRAALPPPVDVHDDGTLGEAQRASIQHYPLPHFLRIEDRNSMAHSVEARLPFLDYRLVTYLLGLDELWRVRGPYNKYVLREAMRGVIPEVVRSRLQKFGFPVSTDAWFSGPVYEPMLDLIASRSFRERGIFDAPRVRAALERHRRGEQRVGTTLFHVAQVERWLESIAEPVAHAGRSTAVNSPAA